MSKETNSKEKTDKKDEDVAAKNKDLQDLKGEVGILKKYISDKATKETATTKKTNEETYQKNRLSKNISGLGKLQTLNPGLGQQSFKTT
jgi:hypothetical protein